MAKLLRIIYQPYKWLVFIPLAVLATIISASLSIVLSYISKRFAARTGGFLWSKSICMITPVSVKLTGRENIKPGQSYVVVANHQSFYDVITLYSKMGMDLRWIMKAELRKIPAFGYANERVGNVYINRENRATSIASIKKAESMLKKGTSLVFFPEGTRSVTGKMGQFKKGAFITAIDMQLPILPVTIDGTSKILPATTFGLFPGSVRITIHAPIDISGISNDNVEELIKASKSVIEKSLTSEK